MVRRGEIWWVDLEPTVGSEIRKIRPAVILQNDKGNEFSPLTIIAPMTSRKLDNVYPFQVLLPRHVTKLQKNSKVLVNQLRSVDKQRLRQRIGRVPTPHLHRIEESLRVVFALD